MEHHLKATFGNIDIYLFDQLLKGRFDHCKNVLDVGCGQGRNLVYFLKQGYDVYGIDQNPEAIATVKALSKQLAPSNNLNNFQLGDIQNMNFEKESFDAVICNAVLHFAKDHNHFDTMLQSIWKTLKPNGLFIARLASNIGIEQLVKPLENGRFLLPDESERYLVNEQMLLTYTESLNAKLIEYIKTTNVQNLRCMTTWCMQKSP